MFNWQLPTQHGTDVFPSNTATPVVVRTIIQWPGDLPQTDLHRRDIEKSAQDILDRQTGALNHFVQRQRQLHSLAGQDYSAKRLNLPGVEAHWRADANTQYITLTVYPPLPEIKEDGAMLLVLHDTNQVTAFTMASLETGADKLLKRHAATLKNSTWTDEIIRVAQYKLDSKSKGVILSAVHFDGNTIREVDTHYLTTIKSNLRDGLASSTLSTWTPHLNGQGGVYYTVNDKFTLEETDASGATELTYSGGYGHVGNIASPYAIEATGTYYYAPVMVPTTQAIVALAAAPHEQSVDAYTDDEITTYAAAAENWGQPPIRDHIGYFLTPAEMDTELHLAAPWGTLGTWNPDIAGFSGYGKYTTSAYTHTLKAATQPPPVITGGPITLFNLTTTPDEFTAAAPGATDIGNDVPVTIYDQREGLDVLEVEFTPFDTHMENADSHITGQSIITNNRVFQATMTTDRTTSFSASFSFRDYTYSVSETSVTQQITQFDRLFGLGIGPPPPPYFKVPEEWVPTGSTTPIDQQTPVESPDRTTEPEFHPDFPFPGPMPVPRYVWLVSFPPCFSTKPGDYYHAAHGQFYTPFTTDKTYTFVVNDAVNEAHQYKMRDIYKPWFHVSNGKVCLQGFELNDERAIYRARKVEGEWEKRDVGDQIAEAVGTSIQNIQAVFMDVPLARIKQFT